MNMFKNIDLSESADDNQRRLSMFSTGTWPDEENKPSMPPPIFGAFYSGWSHSLFTPPADHHTHDSSSPVSSPINEKQFDDADDMSFSSKISSQDEQDSLMQQQLLRRRRKSSMQIGNQVMTELLEKDNVRHAVKILQQALKHLSMTQHEEEEEDNKEQVTKVYSQIMKTLCDPNISKIVDEMTPTNDIYKSILWRLFTKIAESGHVLERDAHLIMVGRLVDKGHTSLALQAMYALPRIEWDTQAYRTAILLHLLQYPKQILEAQRLLSDYGKPYLDIANPIAPTDLPPMRINMPLMKDVVTDNDRFKLWMFYQTVQSKDTSSHWTKEKEHYEQKRQENMEMLKQRQDNTIDWALEQLCIESRKNEVDKKCIDDDNTMIFVAMNNQQFEYGWQVYEAMNESVNESTPCIIMHLCYLAFRQIPIVDISYRTTWEERAWSIYSRFMCSEYLHPNQQDAPSFLHDILSIALHSPEAMIAKRARFTKTMSVYNLLERLQFDRLLSDDRVLEPILCTLMYECKGSALNIVNISNKAFEIWDAKMRILEQFRNAKSKAAATKGQQHDMIGGSTPYSIIWALIVFCLKSGNLVDFKKVISQLIDSDFHLQDIHIPSSLLAPIQKFHDDYACSHRNQCCYFQDYMFRYVDFTENMEPVKMNEYGFLLTTEGIVYDWVQQIQLRSNINEPQEPNIAQAILMGAAKGEELNAKDMYYSINKAKALIRHISKVIFPLQQV